MEVTFHHDKLLDAMFMAIVALHHGTQVHMVQMGMQHT